jgi:hypothetical protein
MRITCFLSVPLLALVFLLAVFSPTFAQLDAAVSTNLKTHITILASDEMEGRNSGSPGAEKAAVYIESWFRQQGIAKVPGLNGYRQDFSFRTKANPHTMAEDSTKPEIKTFNICGWIDNQAEKTIIIGAHYDHLGYGHDGNSLEANSKGMIHNGADDNASGVAAMMEMARLLNNNGIREKSNFLFIAFSGEEFGLFGSKYFADHTPLELNKVKMMFNMDMVGRLDSTSRKLMIYGVGTSPVLVPMVNAIPTTLKLVTDSSGIGPSDHTSFYLKDLPVLHFFTGQHKDYHKPSDDEDKINYQGMVDVMDFILKTVLAADKTEAIPFSKTRNPSQNENISLKVTLGIMPDYTFEGPGLRIDGVTDNKPASKAGVQKGDVLLKMGEKDIKEINSYMKALSEFKKGEEVMLKIKRGEQIVNLSATF